MRNKKTKNHIYFNLYLIFIIDAKLPETGRFVVFLFSLLVCLN